MARAGCAASGSSLTVCCNGQPRKAFDSAHSTTKSKHLSARRDGGVSARYAPILARGPRFGARGTTLYPGPIDTKMGEVLKLEKASPVDTAQAIVTGIMV